MRRVFIQFYLLLIGFFIAIIISLGLFYKKAVDDVSANYVGDLLATVFSLIEQDLQTRPPEQWPQILADEHVDTDFNLQIEPVSYYQLDHSAQTALDQGDVVYILQDKIYIQRIKNSDYLLTVGPINYSYFLKQIELLDLAFLSIVVLLLTIPVYLWLRPLRRDIHQIESAANEIGSGNMEAELVLDKHSAVYPIGQAFNHMSAQVADLMDQQERLIHDIAHEIRTPLARLRYRLALSTIASEMEFSTDIDQVELLINELLFKATLDTQHNTCDINQIFDVSTWLNECIDQAKIDSPSAILWNVYIDTQTSECRGNIQLLTRALSNLLTNAKRFAQQHIDVRFEQIDGHYRLSVADDGLGIPAENAQNIFQAFYRMDQSRTRDTGGYGLGLSIVTSIMQSHNGTASVSSSVYGGACFHLDWPNQT